MTLPVLILHGGAGRSFQNEARRLLVRKKIARILEHSYRRLCDSNALEAVTHAVKLLEDDPEFNAGTGSHLQADGRARLTASIMDGASGRFAAVLNLEKIKNPICVARALLDHDDRILASAGAFEFARELGIPPRDPRTREAIRRWKEWKDAGYDTVGACALDRKGNLASATSTGGRGWERPGRVSDSGMPVANFADIYAAVAATGIGEEIVEEGLAVKIATRVRDGLSLKEAFAKTFSEARKQSRRMGAVGLSRKGGVAWDSTTEVLIFGWRRGKRIELF